MAKTKVGIICGGKSAEHEVSLQSTQNIVEAIDKDKYEVILIGIAKDGQWYLYEDTDFLLGAEDPQEIQLADSDNKVGIIPADKEQQLINLANQEILGDIDVVFPVLHGPYGEDGTIQGLLEMADIPFVGPGVLGSSVGMDKDVMKRLITEAEIPTADFMVADRTSIGEITFEQVEEKLGTPLFIKPANLGSSVGVNKVATAEEFNQALTEAFQFDNKLIIEEFIAGREIECSVLGNQEPMASKPGEILPKKEFYSYEAKYIDENGAGLDIPADLPEKLIQKVQNYAIKTFKTLCCEGLARVDFFIQDNERVLVNEINTIPGFTRISMYPKLWEVSGIEYSELIDRLIQLALQRHEKEKKLKTTLE